MSVEFSKMFLLKILTDPTLEKKIPATVILDVGKRTHGLRRAQLKAARKELGVLSENIGGVQYWRLQKDEP